MDLDVDDVPWTDELLTPPPNVEKGQLILPRTHGWGADIDEAAALRQPPKL